MAQQTITPGTPAAEALPALIERYGPTLHGLALRLCGHRADAEDMVQDVFLQALRKWSTFRGEADPGTWLYTIAVRTCRPRHRRRGGTDRRVQSLSRLMPWSESTVMRAAAGPSTRAEHSEALERVQHEIAHLPEHLRLPVILKEVLGMSIADTARALRIAQNTVKTRLHRARLTLRKAMTAASPSITAPAPIYGKQICLDLLKAKLQALDRGDPGPIPQAEVCARCRAVFRELDIVREACIGMGRGDMTADLKARLLSAIVEPNSRSAPPRRGRRPQTAPQATTRSRPRLTSARRGTSRA